MGLGVESVTDLFGYRGRDHGRSGNSYRNRGCMDGS